MDKSAEMLDPSTPSPDQAPPPPSSSLSPPPSHTSPSSPASSPAPPQSLDCRYPTPSPPSSAAVESPSSGVNSSTQGASADSSPAAATSANPLSQQRQSQLFPPLAPIDRFGFRTQYTPSEKDIQTELKRADKWNEMTQAWPVWIARRSHKIKERCRKGIPDSMRPRAWPLLAGVEEEKRKHPNLFQALLQTHSPMEDCIQRDVHRTFPENIMFFDSLEQGPERLFNVLRAYASFNPEIGYCQGMGFLTAAALMYTLSQEDAFWMLHCLITKYGMHGFFVTGMVGLNKALYVFDKLTKAHMPKLFRHLQDTGVASATFASQWFLTNFLYNFPFFTAVRIWDMYLFDGPKALYRVGLAFLEAIQERVLKMRFEDIITLIQRGAPDVRENPNMLIERATKFTLTHSQLRALEEEFERNEQATAPAPSIPSPNPVRPTLRSGASALVAAPSVPPVAVAPKRRIFGAPAAKPTAGAAPKPTVV